VLGHSGSGHPAKKPLASQTQRAISLSMKITLEIDAKKLKQAKAECGLRTKAAVIDYALSELVRQKAVSRLMSSIGKFPNLMTIDEIEAGEKRHYVRVPSAGRRGTSGRR
jgi:hypothetical protein